MAAEGGLKRPAERSTLKDRDLEAIHALQRAEARHRELERGETFASKRERDNALGPRLEELGEPRSRPEATARLLNPSPTPRNQRGHRMRPPA